MGRFVYCGKILKCFWFWNCYEFLVTLMHLELILEISIKIYLPQIPVLFLSLMLNNSLSATSTLMLNVVLECNYYKYCLVSSRSAVHEAPFTVVASTLPTDSSTSLIKNLLRNGNNILPVGCFSSVTEKTTTTTKKNNAKLKHQVTIHNTCWAEISQSTKRPIDLIDVN